MTHTTETVVICALFLVAIALTILTINGMA